MAANGDATAKIPKPAIVTAVPTGLTKMTSPKAAQPRSTDQSLSVSAAVPESARAAPASITLAARVAMYLFILIIILEPIVQSTETACWIILNHSFKL
jgi:hypothetical protein